MDCPICGKKMFEEEISDTTGNLATFAVNLAITLISGKPSPANCNGVKTRYTCQCGHSFTKGGKFD